MNKSPSPCMGWKKIVKFEGGSKFSSKGLFFRKTIIATSERIVNAIQYPMLFDSDAEFAGLKIF